MTAKTPAFVQLAFAGGFVVAVILGLVALSAEPPPHAATEPRVIARGALPERAGGGHAANLRSDLSARSPSPAELARQPYPEALEAELEPDAPVKDLIAAALRTEDPSVREFLAHELGFRAGDEATDGIVALLGDASPEVRLAAAKSLERRADRRSLFSIAAVVDDEEDLDVERALRRAIGKMAPQR